MRKFLRIFGLLVAVGFTSREARAQLDNRAFISARPGQPRRTTISHAIDGSDDELRRSRELRDSVRRAAAQHLVEETAAASEVRLSLNSFTFFKNNEYFNQIIEGQTLFGTQLNPQLVYYPAQNLRLEAGVFLWKDFGNPRLQLVRPTFRGTWTKGRSQFILGNIRPHLNHDYIEPLFNFERVILRPLEEGLQYRYLGRRLFLDAWVDWQRQQYRFSNFQEELVGGLSGSYSLTGPQSDWQLSLPLQFTATHKGGQIDTVDRPLQTVFNQAAGLVLRRELGSNLQALRLNAYVLGFQDRSGTSVLPFQKGSGLYLNGTLETKYGDAMLSYWQGRRFIAPLGGDLFQSASRTVNSPTYTEAHRRLLLLRLLRDFRIADPAALTVRLEPVYDLNSRRLDFSLGVYLNFRQEWLLGNAGRRVRVGQ